MYDNDGTHDLKIRHYLSPLKFGQRSNGSRMIDHPAIDCFATLVPEVSEVDVGKCGGLSSVKAYHRRDAKDHLEHHGSKTCRVCGVGVDQLIRISQVISHKHQEQK
jgi:hypothetical protein